MNKFILQILLVLFFSITLAAQTDGLEPILLDEFGETGNEDLAMRLDNFIGELSNAPNKKGIVRIYGGSEKCFLCNYRSGSWIDPYLKNTRKLKPERYEIEYCDEESLRIQLYLLPNESMLPKCEEKVELPKKSTLFEDTAFYSDSNNIIPLEDTVIDVVGWSNGEYSRNALKKVKGFLEESPESKIYIVVYLVTNLEQGYYDEKKGWIEKEIRNLDKKSLAKTLIKNAKEEFVKNGINPSQIESIEGGFIDDRRKLEFWLVPPDGEIPKSQPNYFPKNKQN